MASVEFLNVDLDIESNTDLSPVFENLGKKISVLNNQNENGVFKYSLEIGKCLESPGLVLKEFFSIFLALPPEFREFYLDCSRMVFDVGFECEGKASGSPIQIREIVSSDIIHSLSKMNAEIAITVYSV